jgi:hypothetical protein
MFIPNSDNSEDKILDSESAMNNAMEYIWDEFIMPNIDKTDSKQIDMVTVIGLVLRSIAEKASAYEKTQEGKFDDKDHFSRN